MPSDDDKRLDVLLLVGAALAVVLVAAMAAWAARLGGGDWPLVLAPFVLVLAVPIATLAWLRTAEREEWRQLPSGTDRQPTLDATRTAA